MAFEDEERGVECRSALEWIANSGAGQSVSSAINTMAFSFLIPEGSDEAAQFYLKQAIAMDVMDEATNAMANLGGLHIRMGRYDQAVEVLMQALDRPDKFAEGEASFLLGRAYRELGELSTAMEFFERASVSADESYAQQARDELAKLGHGTRPQQPIGRARFCGNCGSQFNTDAENFCANCGQPRP